MITIDLAEQVRAAGLVWVPASGDRFVIPRRGMDDDVFHVAEMTIEIHNHHGDDVVKFNGTTEWALDSVPANDVVWLPREDQLRAALADDLVALEHEGDHWIVTVSVGDHLERVRDNDVECAYARGLLASMAVGREQEPADVL